jgi:hypothetical protein
MLMPPPLLQQSKDVCRGLPGFVSRGAVGLAAAPLLGKI